MVTMDLLLIQILTTVISLTVVNLMVIRMRDLTNPSILMLMVTILSGVLVDPLSGLLGALLIRANDLQKPLTSMRGL